MFNGSVIFIRPGTVALTVAVLALGACGRPADDPASSGPVPPVATADSTATDGATGKAPAALRFTARTVGGQAFDATTLAGKPTVFWFWAAWCVECRAHAEDVAAVQRDYADRINVVGVVGLDSGADAVRDFIRERKIDGFLNLADNDGAVWRRFRVASQDHYVILSRAGQVLHAGPLSPAALRQRVDALS